MLPPEHHGRRTAIRLRLTPDDRTTLEAWQRRQSLPHGQVRRARAILLLADGVTIARTSRLVGMARRDIYRWVARFQAHGCEGLKDMPRPGPVRRRVLGALRGEDRC